MPGIKIRYTKPNNGLALIPIVSLPFQWDSLKKVCNLCQVPHLVKAVHLWLDDNDECLVSTGVLERLKKAGMPDLIVTGSVDKPPPLHIGRQLRQAEDANNRRHDQRHDRRRGAYVGRLHKRYCSCVQDNGECSSINTSF